MCRVLSWQGANHTLSAVDCVVGVTEFRMMKKIVKGLADVIVDNILEFHPQPRTLLVTVGKELRIDQRDVCTMKREEKFGYIEVMFIDEDGGGGVTPFLLPADGDADEIRIFEGPASLFCRDLEDGDIIRGFVDDVVMFESSPFEALDHPFWDREWMRRQRWICDVLVDIFNINW